MNEKRTDMLDIASAAITLVGLGVIIYGVGWGSSGDGLLGLFVTALGVGMLAWRRTGV